ncbi:hypothetical protein PYV02_06555 [Leifsonia sp. H3M29-4]|uniref:hypothetical protein n=1 Tax=Salinibacterium metalliresistens TaxID=3031321 RepID=UPI0023DB6B46|nr:hypothetical protein [Salinibacterium metalliresistens]MDF1478744.1 hypothetical protein [Salinibacterium metalliresistens]
MKESASRGYAVAIAVCASATVLALVALNFALTTPALVLGCTAFVAAIVATVAGSRSAGSGEREIAGGFLAVFGVLGASAWVWLVTFAVFYDKDPIYLCGHLLGRDYDSLEFQRSYIPPAILCSADSSFPTSATAPQTTLLWSVGLLIPLVMIGIASVIALRRHPSREVVGTQEP